MDRTVVINLDRDTERWSAFERRWAAVRASGWPVPKRFAALDGAEMVLPPWWRAGAAAWGCFRSHLAVLEMAYRDRIQTLAVFEDDAVFADDFGQRWRRFDDQLPDDLRWVYLGGQHIDRTAGVPLKISEHVYQPHNVHRAHAYVIRRPAIQHVVEHLWSREAWGARGHVDHRFGELHAAMVGVYCPDRWLVGQAAGVSNIKGKALPENWFPDSIDVADPPLPAGHAPAIVVWGPRDESRLRVAAVLHEAFLNDRGGASMGAGQPGSGRTYAAPGLERIIDRLVAPGESIRPTEPVRHAMLRDWLGRRIAAVGDDQPVGATDDRLPALVDAISRAWDSPTVVLVEPGSRNQMDAVGFGRIVEIDVASSPLDVRERLVDTGLVR